MKIDYSSTFKKAYKKRTSNHPQLKNRFKEKMALFYSNPWHPALKTHKLVGKLKNSYSFSVDYDCRIVFKFISDDHILLIDIGKHDEVY
ncbi:MAG: type II toxin-antitoxin system mRNA interferase toxin, RelE/StbE family [Spirochaetia bacterium]|nr:type II toxin-antitoxin system mRNA interferase toxin, RelE/StbE family [Spirochaetia bacterium]